MPGFNLKRRFVKVEASILSICCPTSDYTGPDIITFVMLSVSKCNVFARKSDMSRCRYLRLSQFKKNLRYPMKSIPNWRDSKLRFISVHAPTWLSFCYD